MTMHQYETNHLRNIACFFAHLLASISCAVFECTKINKEGVTLNSRISIKIMMGEMMGSVDIEVPAEKFKDEEVEDVRVCSRWPMSRRTLGVLRIIS